MNDSVAGRPVAVSDATVSSCETWRYRLQRRWGGGPGVLWVLLNPSTADAELDDPTVRRIVGFSTAFGFDAATVVNLYALRTSDPRSLSAHRDPVGPDNDAHIACEASRHEVAIVGWGAHRGVGLLGRLEHRQRVATVERLLAGLDVRCLGRTAENHPRHPLYLPAAAGWEPYLATDDGREWRCEACRGRGWAWCGDADLPEGCAERICDGAEHLCPGCAGTGVVAARAGGQMGAQASLARRDVAS